MGGVNPYIQSSQVSKPQKKYKIHFEYPNGTIKTVEVDPDKIPYGDTGLPGSILEIALAHHIDIDHACGGVCACATCHVIIKEGWESCNEQADAEMDQLDNAPALEKHSRLSCQTVPNGTKDITVSVPSWNRNLIKEGH